MKAVFSLALLIISSLTVYSQNFYLAPNGVTCMCPNAAVGDSGDPGNGIVYTKRTAAEITPQNAATTCTSGINHMNSLFSGFTTFNEDISSWDVSQVCCMDYMFRNTLLFNQDLSNWDVSNVFGMRSMFQNSAFNGDISSWDVSNVVSFTEMFFGNTAFNRPIDSWDISSATHLEYMFRNATSFNQPLNSWNTSNIMTFRGMFWGATSFNQPLNNWSTIAAVQMDSIFYDATSFNQDLSSWIFLSLQGGLSGFVANSGLDIENYDLLLSSFVNQGLTGLNMNSQNLLYCNLSSRNELVNNLGWTISGDQYNASSVTAPNNIQVVLSAGECSLSNLDLGVPNFIEGCGPITISNNAPQEYFPGTYQVTWTLEDANGLLYNDAQIVEIIFPVDQADVCYVTADVITPSNNRIFITSDPALNGQNVDFHEVLRESPSGAYETIGFIVPPEDSFLDVTSDNNTQAYRYKVQTTDVCGQVLALSDFHKTILLQSSIATDNSVNLAWNPYIGVSFNTYNIYRSVNGGNYELLNSVSSTNTSYNDTSANVVDNFYEYYISIDVASCNTDPLQSFALRSNLEYVNPNLSIGNNTVLSKSVILYPNPASELIRISASEGVEVRSLILYSALGQRIISLQGANSMDVSKLPSGVYYMTIETDQGRLTKSLVRK